ncbi:MAG: TolC family protein [Bacteroidales bacterium]|nr:TolC family protein [Bacteroidales bacterium]
MNKKNQYNYKIIKKSIIIAGLIISTLSKTYCQEETITLTLKNSIETALQQSPEYYIIKHQYLSKYWKYKSFKSRLLPFIDFHSTLTDFNRSISRITLPDGSDAFINRSLNNSSCNLTINQQIFTGGRFFISSGLQRIDLLGDSTVTSFLSSPVNIGFTQPIFSYNSFKWEKKIEPVEYEEAKRQFVVDHEEISIMTVAHFFDYALAQLNFEIETINYNNNDTLYEIGKGRYNMGTIAQDELLQLELNHLNSRSVLKQSKIDLETKKQKLIGFLGLSNNVEIKIIIPTKMPVIKIDAGKALNYALQNNPASFNFKKQLLNAESNLEKAKLKKHFNANLTASYGLTQTSRQIDNIYINPQDKQSVSLGIEIPILDWGNNKMNYEMAKSKLNVTNLIVKKSKQEFQQNVIIEVSKFNILKEQMVIAAKSDTIANLKYQISKKKYISGKISIIDLNIASSEKDIAKRKHLNELKNYWIQHYYLRELTLFDFKNNQNLIDLYDFKNMQ